MKYFNSFEGNKWVTAAKSLVSGVCGIDMLAGIITYTLIFIVVKNIFIIINDN